jgi:hypothetical protein
MRVGGQSLPLFWSRRIASDSNSMYSMDSSVEFPLMLDLGCFRAAQIFNRKKRAGCFHWIGGMPAGALPAKNIINILVAKARDITIIIK